MPDLPRQVYDLVWAPDVDRWTILDLLDAAPTREEALVLIAQALRQGETPKRIQEHIQRFLQVARHNAFADVEALSWCVGLETGVDPVHALRSLFECCVKAGDTLSALECAGLLMGLNPRSASFQDMLRNSHAALVASGEWDGNAALLLYAGPAINYLNGDYLDQAEAQRALSQLAAEPAIALRVVINLWAMRLYPEDSLWPMSRAAGVSPEVIELARGLVAADGHPPVALAQGNAAWLGQSVYTNALLELLDPTAMQGGSDCDAYTLDLCQKLPHLAQARGQMLYDRMRGRPQQSLLIEAVLLARLPLDAASIETMIRRIRSVDGPSVPRRMQSLMQVVGAQGALPPERMFNLFDIDPSNPTSLAQAQIVVRMYAQSGQHDAAFEAALQMVRLSDRSDHAVVQAIEAAFRAGHEAQGHEMLRTLAAANPPALVRLRLGRIAASKGDSPLAARLIDGLEDLSHSTREPQAGLEVLTLGEPGRLREQLMEDALPRARFERPRLAVFDPGFSTVAGHHMAQAEFLFDFYRHQFGFGPKDIAYLIGLDPKDRTGDAPILENLTPTFAINPYNLEYLCQDAHAVENMNHAMARDLERSDLVRSVGRTQIFHWHTTHAGLISGFADWAVRHLAGNRPIFVLGMVVMDFLATHAPDDPFRRACIRAYQDGIARLRDIPGATVIAYTETKAVRDAMAEVIGPEPNVHILPYLPAALAGNPKDFPDPLSRDGVRFGIVGGNRAERGLDLFAPLIERFEDRPEVTWTLQMSRAFAAEQVPEQIAILERAERKGILRWLNEPRLDQKTYFDALSGMDCVVMPYRERYASSGSGVFYEALQLGKFLVVPHGTFMREALEEAGYPHQSASGVEVDSFAEAIDAVLRQKEAHRSALDAFRSSGVQLLPVGRFAELIQAALDERLPCCQ